MQQGLHRLVRHRNAYHVAQQNLEFHVARNTAMQDMVSLQRLGMLLAVGQCGIIEGARPYLVGIQNHAVAVEYQRVVGV